MDDIRTIINSAVYKHLAGQHNQKLHGNRGGVVSREARADTLAAEKISEAKMYEPEITSMLLSTSKDLGGTMDKIDFRLKSQDSMTRKILSNSIEHGITEEAEANKISDVLRYTMVFDNPKTYTSNVLTAVAKMKEMGYTKHDNRWRNYFSPGNAYNGYNTVWENKNGMKFELQFHTTESLTIKEKVHQIYEKYRKLPQNSKLRPVLAKEMVDAWNVYERPSGWETLEGNIIGAKK
jgi:hypothetical protein